MRVASRPILRRRVPARSSTQGRTLRPGGALSRMPNVLSAAARAQAASEVAKSRHNAGYRRYRLGGTAASLVQLLGVKPTSPLRRPPFQAAGIRDNRRRRAPRARARAPPGTRLGPDADSTSPGRVRSARLRSSRVRMASRRATRGRRPRRALPRSCTHGDVVSTAASSVSSDFVCGRARIQDESGAQLPDAPPLTVRLDQTRLTVLRVITTMHTACTPCRRPP